MRPTDFARVLRASAPLFKHETATGLCVLGELFDASPSASVAATIKRLARAALASTSANPCVGDVLSDMLPFQEFLNNFGKPAVAKDTQIVADFLQNFESAGIRPFVDDAVAALTAVAPAQPILKIAVVQNHVQRLEQALGDSAGFTAAYNELERDPDVGKLEIAEIAKLFTQRTIKSRPAALKKIWARHNSLMTFKAKSESRDGRSAA